MSEIINEHIPDSLVDNSINSKDSEVENSDRDVSQRRRSWAILLQHSSDSDDSSDCEISTESYRYSEVRSDVDKITSIPDFIGELDPMIFPTNKKSMEEVVELFIGNHLF